ncbi:hypothetical protein [Anatilimnocola aggregata]|uniref:hypothetical protein n=1 Tax=Anatilimnocola aggregata TaxID=2528021 RepID=UPI0011A217F4|nr:hypothetical protein [Anatilimnocola aggregata]
MLDSPRNSGDVAYKDVKAAYDQLADNFEVSLPSIMQGVDDNRFSHWREVPSNGVFAAYSVGHACRSLIAAHIEVYQGQIAFLDDTGVPRSLYFIESTGGYKVWYQSRKDKPLFELQLEAIDWALRQPHDKRIEPKVWNDGRAELSKFRANFVKIGKPLNPNHELQFEGK